MQKPEDTTSLAGGSPLERGVRRHWRKKWNDMAESIIGRLACAIGLHSAVRREKWTPSLAAKVVTEFEQTHTCKRCAKVLHHIHWQWNGEEMVDVVTPNAGGNRRA